MSIFGLGWYSHRETRDQHSLFLSTAFLAVGLLDFMHTLSYEGMPDFITPNSANKSSQFWIIARFFAAAVFVLSALFASKKIFRYVSKWIYLFSALVFVSGVSWLITFIPALLPSTFEADSGLTPFKKNAEYVIICLLVVAAYVYARRGKEWKNRYDAIYASAMVLCIFSELAFAMYFSVFDSYNVFGHLLKIVAFGLIYKGLFIASVNRPYDRLANLNKELQLKIGEHEAATRQVEALSTELMRISELERAQIAGELHDSLGQYLVLATLKLRAYLDSGQEATPAEKQAILEPIQNALQTARNISHRLTPAHLENLGMRLAIEDLLETIGKTSKLALRYDLAALENFPGRWNIDFYRIVQEALTNIIKHASASQVSVIARKVGDGIELTISDDGAGLSRGVKSGGVGMLLMQQRARTFGGRVMFQSLNPGFAVVVDIPALVGAPAA
jgi:signal transduction histidine kinase